MNERIKELIKQCSDYDYRSGTTDFDKERFAELIIRECAEQCQEDYDSRWILNHFGVEE